MREIKCDERNKVNELTGAEWLKNSINFWEFQDYDLLQIFNKFKDFCYKNRTNSKYIANIDKIVCNESDFSFNVLRSLEDAKRILNVVKAGAYNSYHVVFFEHEFMDNKFIPSYFTKNLDINGVEYRGKIVINIKSDSSIKYALLFLNRLTNDNIKLPNYDFDNIFSKLEKPYIIESKSKMDKIGLQHPAPYSYIDIYKISQIEKIENQVILDPFLGVGSTIIGTFEKNYNIGIELNNSYVNLIYDRFKLLNLPLSIIEKSKIICGDSLEEVDNINVKIGSVITSPPYFNILKNKSSGIRTDNSQSRQGIEYYSDSDKDVGNINNYNLYIDSMKLLFSKIKDKMSAKGRVYLIISDFTVNRKEKDIHSDFVKLFSEIGYTYVTTSYIRQNQKAIYPFGYPYKIVINHIFQYIIIFEVNNYE